MQFLPIREITNVISSPLGIGPGKGTFFLHKIVINYLFRS